MTETELAAHRQRLLAEEMQSPETWWWLSFVDGSRPKGQQFLGGAIVRGHGMLTAVLVAHHLGINPGGEVQGASLEHIEDINAFVAPAYRERLLNYDDMVAAGLKPRRWTT